MGVLSGEKIKKRAKDIFETGYKEECVDIAYYNLRINDKNMIIDGKIYDENNPYDYKANDGIIRLPAKKISVISTIEKFKMSRDLCANIGIKFSYSRRGLIPLFGGFPRVDPCYNDYFYAAIYNSSNKDLSLKKGDKVLKMGIQTVNTTTKINCHQSNTKFSKIAKELRELTKEETTKKLKEGLDKSEKEIKDLEEKIKSTHEKIEEVSAGYRSTVWFGVFLISASIFGVILSFLLSTANYLKIANIMSMGWLSLVIFITIALFICGWVLTLITVIKNINRKEATHNK